VEVGDAGEEDADARVGLAVQVLRGAHGCTRILDLGLG
jgi:hypothetical protein